MKAFLLRESEPTPQDPKKRVVGAVTELSAQSYPDQGPITVAVSHSAMNYKDGMVVQGLGRLVRRYPHVPGIDYTGVVSGATSGQALKEAHLREGDSVLLTGWRVGEWHWGGYAQEARAQAQWLVPLPPRFDAVQAVALGTAGLTAMLAITRLERAGMEPSKGQVLVTGAGGGVGTIAVGLLATLGYSVVAMSGKAELQPQLRALGAAEVIGRDALAGGGKPLEETAYQAAIDTVGGDVLGRVCAHIAYAGHVAAIGLAGGVNLTGTLLPFLLRGVSLLGIDSVMVAKEERLAIWSRLADVFDAQAYAPLIQTHPMEEIPQIAQRILAGQQSGRAVIVIS